jgi:hypothetical protein
MPRSTKLPPATAQKSTRTRKPTAPATLTSDSSTITSNGTLSHDDIAARAYELFLVEGAPHGRDVEHWLRAEHELRERYTLSGQ